MDILIDFILYVFAVIGLTHIIVDSDMPLVVWLREKGKEILRKFDSQEEGKTSWTKLLECYQCCGTWSGFLCGLILLLPSNAWLCIIEYFRTMSLIQAIWMTMFRLGGNLLFVFLCGMAGSYVSQWGIYNLELIQAKSLSNLTED